MSSRDPRWAVPFAVAIGIPMYSNAASIIPIVEALPEKGAVSGFATAYLGSRAAVWANRVHQVCGVILPGVGTLILFWLARHALA